MCVPNKREREKHREREREEEARFIVSKWKRGEGREGENEGREKHARASGTCIE